MVLPDDARIKVVAFVVFLRRRRRRRLCVVVDVDDGVILISQKSEGSLSLSYLILLAAAFDTSSCRKKQL